MLEKPHGFNGFRRMVQPRDGHSNKSRLMPPSPDEIMKLAQLFHRTKFEAIPKGKQVIPHRTLRRHLSPETIEELVARYAAGEKILALSREFGISDSGLRELLLAEGVSLRGHAMTVQDAETAVQLHEYGLTIKQIIAQIGYSPGTIRKVLREHGAMTKSAGHGKRVVTGE
jgi:transposase-like protein